MSRPLHVLLIEDNQADADLTREILEDSKLLIEVAVAPDGPRALERLASGARGTTDWLPDLILLDLNLPRMDGREVLAALKADPVLRTIPVVILTSSDAEQDVVKSYNLGANCYVKKPVGLEAFQAIVRAVESFWFTVVKLP